MLTSFALGGLSEAAKFANLNSFAGQRAEEVFAAIENFLAPKGASLEEASARMAVADTLALLYERCAVDSAGLSSLESMTADMVKDAIINTISSYIFYRWVQELGASIERGATNAREAVAVEREMKRYVFETVKLDLSSEDVLNIDWSGKKGRAFIQKIFAEAYAFLQ